MRIAFVYDALYPWVKGGGERRYHEVALRLRERHEVHFVSWQWWEGRSRLERDGMTFHGVGRPPSLYGGDGKRTVREAAGFAARVLPVLLRNRWDVIDCSATPYVPLYPVWLAARVTGTRLVVTWHEFWGEHWDEYLAGRQGVAALARRIEAAGLGLGDRVVAVSDFTARRMGLAGDPRLTVVGNGVSLAEIDAELPARVPAGVLYVGRLIDDKRVDLLLDAMRVVSSRLPDLRCSIVGDGPERPALERMAWDLGIAERVRFHSQVEGPAVYGLMKSASLLVLPSLREGFGMTVAEAQACGTVPIVVRSPASAAPDLVRDGVDGAVVNPDAASLASELLEVLLTPGRLAAMSAAARRVGAQRDWSLIADQLEAVYQGDVLVEPAEAPIGSLRWS